MADVVGQSRFFSGDYIYGSSESVNCISAIYPE